MQAYPTRNTFHVAIAGAMVIVSGLAARLPAVVAIGGAIVVAVAAGRALSLLAISRLRAAGFEMVWSTPQRVLSLSTLGETVLHAELRNRGYEEVRGVSIRTLSSSMLDIVLEPTRIDLPARGRVKIELTIRAKRIGRWAIHGVALEVRGVAAGGEGLYEIPLLFANPLGVEVLPAPLYSLVHGAKGGRSRHISESGGSANAPGEGDELRELREHVAGDPFKRIAWRASARRGRLMVREMERQEREVVWLVLDASVELWAGPLGCAPLDKGVAEMAGLAAKHLRRGDRVGLAIVASRIRTWLPPDSGPRVIAEIIRAFLGMTNFVDVDRTELDEAEVAALVLEHARPLDTEGLGGIRRGDYDALVERAEILRARAPFVPRVPFAPTPREQRLRRYLAAFGVEVPPRVDGERKATEATLASVLTRIASEKRRASLVHVWGPVPESGGDAMRALRQAREKRIEVRWTTPNFERALELRSEGQLSPREIVVRDAIRIRAKAAKTRGLSLLRRAGAKHLELAK